MNSFVQNGIRKCFGFSRLASLKYKLIIIAIIKLEHKAEFELRLNFLQSNIVPY